MRHPTLYLGLDVGGTKCAAVVGDDAGRILDRIEWASEATRGPLSMIEDLCRHGQELIKQHQRVVGVGVSIGGPLDANQGIIHAPPNLPGWNATPLKRIVQERLSLPVRVEHDAAACCLAEYHWGGGKGASRLIYLTCGTGFGAGIVIDGLIYRGAGGRNPEIGHARFRPDGPVGFGKPGSIEGYCAGGSMGALARFLYPQRWSAQIPSAPDLARLARSGDADAQHVLAMNAQATGEVCALLGDLFRPDCILLGSLAQHLGDMWVPAVRQRFREEALEETSANCRVEPAQLGKRLQDCSALVVALTAAQRQH